AGLGGTFTGFFLGLRVCGPRINICWTERHPREIAEDIRTGATTMTQLTEHSRRLVLAELARMGNGLALEHSAQFITPTGVQDRFAGRPEPQWAHTEQEW
ncbi:MAG: hypothetical protein ACRDRL_04015, partial [Sciscionella sp.]